MSWRRSLKIIMIDLWYIDTKNVSHESVKELLTVLPRNIINEIMRFRNHEDQRLKLFGKLLVEKYYEDHGLEFNWSNWRISSSGKPYHTGNKKFNISHSGNYVAVCFSDQEVGTDIEQITNFDLTSVLSYLHPCEIEWIKNQIDTGDAFFKIWTRKEAYLKAIGIGIIDGLNNENCLENELTYKDKWYLHSLSFISNYQMALCTKVSDCKINTRQLQTDELI